MVRCCHDAQSSSRELGSRRPRHAGKGSPLATRPVRLVRAGAAFPTAVGGSQSYLGSQNRLTIGATRKTLRMRKKSNEVAERRAAGQKEAVEAGVRTHGVKVAAVAPVNRRHRRETSLRRRVLRCSPRARVNEGAEAERKARPQRRAPQVRGAVVVVELAVHQSVRQPQKPAVVEVRHRQRSAARSEQTVFPPQEAGADPEPEAVVARV